MGRTRSGVTRTPRRKKPVGVAGYRDTMIATRHVSVEDDVSSLFVRTEQEMECKFGHTKSMKSDLDVFYATGETGEFCIEIRGPKKDTVNLMFVNAIKAVGWKVAN